jgi:hypothetical protein
MSAIEHSLVQIILFLGLVALFDPLLGKKINDWF